CPTASFNAISASVGLTGWGPPSGHGTGEIFASAFTSPQYIGVRQAAVAFTLEFMRLTAQVEYCGTVESPTTGDIRVFASGQPVGAEQPGPGTGPSWHAPN